MSRTDKDRPYWVMGNDPTYRRTAYHNHDLLGKTVYHNAYVKDAKGNYLYEDITRTRLMYRSGVPSIIPDREVNRWITEYLNVNGSLKSSYYEVNEVVGQRRVTERIVDFVYPDHCTINEPTPSGYRWKNGQPCYYWADRHFYYDGPDKDDKRYINGVERTKERLTMRRFLKEVNSSGYSYNLTDDDEPYGYSENYSTDYFDDSLSGDVHRKWGWWD
jgi:hypothetical protein